MFEFIGSTKQSQNESYCVLIISALLIVILTFRSADAFLPNFDVVIIVLDLWTYLEN